MSLLGRRDVHPEQSRGVRKTNVVCDERNHVRSKREGGCEVERIEAAQDRRGKGVCGLDDQVVDSEQRQSGRTSWARWSRSGLTRSTARTSSIRVSCDEKIRKPGVRPVAFTA